MRIKYRKTTHTRQIALNFSTEKKTLQSLIKLQQTWSQFCVHVLCCARFKAAGGQFISTTVPRIKSSANRVEMKAWLRLCASKTKDLICVILQKQQDMTRFLLSKEMRALKLWSRQQCVNGVLLLSVSLHTNDWLSAFSWRLFRH